MKRAIILLVISIIAACSVPAPSLAKRERIDVVRRAFRNTVALQANGRVYCSGVISERRIVTAAHCVSGKTVVGVEHRGYLFAATVAHWDGVQDVAVLEAPHRLPRGVPLARRAPRLAETIWVIGHSLGWLDYSVTRGVVGHPRRDLPELGPMVWMQHDAGALGGNSGGPVLNQHGRLVGLTSFGILDGLTCRFGCPGAFETTHINGAVHWETLNSLDI